MCFNKIWLERAKRYTERPYMTYYMCFIQTLIIRIVRILTGSDYSAHSESLFIELKIMNVFQQHRYFTGILVFNCISNMYLKYWNNLFHQSNNLRFRNDLKIKYFKKKITQSSVQYSGPKIWNTFSAKTKMSTKLSTMKRTLKRDILSH